MLLMVEGLGVIGHMSDFLFVLSGGGKGDVDGVRGWGREGLVGEGFPTQAIFNRLSHHHV